MDVHFSLSVWSDLLSVRILLNDHSLWWKWCCRHIHGIHHHSQSIEVDNYCLIEFIDLLCSAFSSSCYEIHILEVSLPCMYPDFFTYGKQKTLLWYNYFKDPLLIFGLVCAYWTEQRIGCCSTGEENNWSLVGCVWSSCFMFLEIIVAQRILVCMLWRLGCNWLIFVDSKSWD